MFHKVHLAGGIVLDLNLSEEEVTLIGNAIMTSQAVRTKFFAGTPTAIYLAEKPVETVPRIPQPKAFRPEPTPEISETMQAQLAAAGINPSEAQTELARADKYAEVNQGRRGPPHGFEPIVAEPTGKSIASSHAPRAFRPSDADPKPFTPESSGPRPLSNPGYRS